MCTMNCFVSSLKQILYKKNELFKADQGDLLIDIHKKEISSTQKINSVKYTFFMLLSPYLSLKQHLKLKKHTSNFLH